MKKILISLLLASSLIFISWDIFAATIDVTEKIPGANCIKTSSSNWQNGVITHIYTCDPGRGFDGVLWVVGAIIKYFTYIASLAAVLFIVINGLLYSMAWINDGLKTGAKERITKTLMGLVILLLSGVILNIIAPWVYK
jgi:ABC-type antimicrobial peptide transport system permease subunit